MAVASFGVAKADKSLQLCYNVWQKIETNQCVISFSRETEMKRRRFYVGNLGCD